MAILYDAAISWKALLNTKYQITYGKKGKLYTLTLAFRPDHFCHLCGIHHINDIDTKLPYSKESFYTMVLEHKLDNIPIQKSSSWNDISGRLQALQKLQSILDSDFILYLFQSKVLPFYSDIDANYLIKNTVTNDVVFLFLDGSSQELFCRSLFTKTDRDYSINQKSVAILKKVKIKNGNKYVLFDKISKKE